MPLAGLNYPSRECRAAYDAACAAARVAEQPAPCWFDFSHKWEARNQPSGGSAIADDFASLADGEGSLWQV
jgi:hypothetical protein